MALRQRLGAAHESNFIPAPGRDGLASSTPPIRPIANARNDSAPTRAIHCRRVGTMRSSSQPTRTNPLRAEPLKGDVMATEPVALMTPLVRARLVRRVRLLVRGVIAYNAIEGVIAITAGVAASSAGSAKTACVERRSAGASVRFGMGLS